MDMLTVNYPYTFKQACLISSIDLTVGQSFIFLQLLSIWQFEGEVLKIAQMFSFSIQNYSFFLALFETLVVDIQRLDFSVWSTLFQIFLLINKNRLKWQ